VRSDGGGGAHLHGECQHDGHSKGIALLASVRRVGRREGLRDSDAEPNADQ
jgi:hypothetical protein